MKILDGRKLKSEIATSLKNEIDSFVNNGKNCPKLVIIQIGDNPVSNIYIKQKMNFAEQIGAKAVLEKFDEKVSSDIVVAKIKELNLDNSVHGMIVQLPLSAHIDLPNILNEIKPEKDVDGLGAINIHKLVRDDKTGIIPATARGIITLLEKNDIEIAGKNITVIGRSLLVGKSLSLSLINKNATVTTCHSETKNIFQFTKNADIIISAAGKPGIINDDMVSENQIIVDVGITKTEDGNICGDVKLDKKTVAAISPVPGGVGQMTVASLFLNLFDTYKNQ